MTVISEEITIMSDDRTFERQIAVAAGETVRHEHSDIIPDGEKWEISRVITSVPNDANSYAALKFGDDLLFYAYTDRDVRLARVVTGDGTRRLTIELHNAGNAATPLGLLPTCRKL